MMFHAKVRAKAKLPLLKRLFPTYKGRTVYLCEGETCQITDYWDEGSRAYSMLFDPYSPTGGALSLMTWPRLFSQQVAGNPYHATMGSLTLEPGIALAEHQFSGTRQYLRVTLHPVDFARLKGEWI